MIQSDMGLRGEQGQLLLVRVDGLGTGLRVQLLGIVCRAGWLARTFS